VTCVHPRYSNDHCAEMSCSNYVNRCFRHAPSGSPDAECTATPLTDAEQHHYDFHSRHFPMSDCNVAECRKATREATR
jgi:hypothetical protein